MGATRAQSASYTRDGDIGLIAKRLRSAAGESTLLIKYQTTLESPVCCNAG